MLESLQSYFHLPSFFSEDSQEIKDKKELKSLLKSGDNNAISNFFVSHRELLNEPIIDTKLTPLEYALTQNKHTLIPSLISLGAKINQPTAHNISVLDQIILQDDPSTLNNAFGTTLGKIFHLTQKHINHVKYKTKNNVFQKAKEQLIAIQKEMAPYQKVDSFKDLSNPLIELHEKGLLQEAKSIDSYLPKQIFDALIYFTLDHQNKAIEVLYNHFGENILKIQTTDLKNLYHFAAIADNHKLIQKLSVWGLGYSAELEASNSKHTRIFSPLYYSIFHPTLDTFIALNQAKITMQPQAPLDAFSQKDLATAPALNTLQLIVLRAILNDPLPQIEPIILGHALINFFAPPEVNDNPFLQATFQTYRTLLVTSICAKDFSSLFEHLNLKKFSYLSYVLFSMVFNSPVPLPYIGDLSKYAEFLKYFSSALLIKRIWNNFSAYQKTYQMRPKQTFLRAAVDLFYTGSFIQNTFFDKPIASYFENIQSSRRTKHSRMKSKEFKNILTNEEFDVLKKQTLNIDKADMGQCTQNLYRCNHNFASDLCKTNSIFSCLEDKKLINQNKFNLQLADKNRLLKHYFKTVHPDKCKESKDLCKRIYDALYSILFSFDT